MTARASSLAAYSASLAGILGWAWREAALSLPGPLRHLGVTRRARLIGLAADGQAGPPGAAVRSVTGLWRSAPGRPGERADDIVLLGEDRVYRRRLVLSPAAARHAREAVAHRLEEICPLPLDEAGWAWRPLGRTPQGGLEVELAIARRSDVADAAGRVSAQARRWQVAAGFGETGPVLVFDRAANAGGRRQALQLAIAGGLLILALFAADWRLDRDLAVLAAQRETLVDQARELREAARLGEELAPVLDRISAYPTLAETLTASAAAVSGLPGEAPVSALRINQRQLSLIPADPDAAPVAHLVEEAS